MVFLVSRVGKQHFHLTQARSFSLRCIYDTRNAIVSETHNRASKDFGGKTPCMFLRVVEVFILLSLPPSPRAPASARTRKRPLRTVVSASTLSLPSPKPSRTLTTTPAQTPISPSMIPSMSTPASTPTATPTLKRILLLFGPLLLSKQRRSSTSAPTSPMMRPLTPTLPTPTPPAPMPKITSQLSMIRSPTRRKKSKIT
ncbi:hypothetical protein BU26DRAFT_231257 [Trematosphaeria pertusa]|uniref:Uncharacterized protein n=1 Tax=Trematosphaeria pertusa TaxID=390896 RepID=A0A6A6IUT5_9PLEO|nr:uncharacterized protein BU26DRAFT_231257 [Trematosphaeria pertusa]KAF2253887.1 hypothetical protein BU26DRAFT_231257 [Trematosphaeria pertusa]